MTSILITLGIVMCLSASPYLLSFYHEVKTVAKFKKADVSVLRPRYKRIFEDKTDILDLILSHAFLLIFFHILYMMALLILGVKPIDGILWVPLMLYITINLGYQSYKQLHRANRIRKDEVQCEYMLPSAIFKHVLEVYDFDKYVDLQNRQIRYGTPEFKLVKSIQEDLSTKVIVEDALAKKVRTEGVDDTAREIHEKLRELDRRIKSRVKTLTFKNPTPLKEKDATSVNHENIDSVLANFLGKNMDEKTEKAPEIKELESLLEEELSPDQRITVEKALDEIKQKKAQRKEAVDNDMRVDSIVRAARMMNHLE